MLSDKAQYNSALQINESFCYYALANAKCHSGDTFLYHARLLF